LSLLDSAVIYDYFLLSAIRYWLFALCVLLCAWCQMPTAYCLLL